MSYSPLKLSIFFLAFVSFAFLTGAQTDELNIANDEEIEINVEEIYEEIWDELTDLLAEAENDFSGFEVGAEDGQGLDLIDIQIHRERQREIRRPNRRRVTCQNCDPSLETLEKQFGGFVLFETLVLPSLIDSRIRISQIQQLANKFADNLANCIHRYNPALNIQQFRRAARDLTHTTIHALQRNTLNRSQTRRTLNRDFNVLTKFWQNFIFPNFPAAKINANFDRAITLIARIRGQSVNNRRLGLIAPFQLYNTLLISLVEIINPGRACF